MLCYKLKVWLLTLHIQGVCQNKEAHRWSCMDPDCMGRQLLSAQPPETNICRSPSSNPLCLCDQPDFKSKATVIPGEEWVLYLILYIVRTVARYLCIFSLSIPLWEWCALQAMVLSTRHQTIKDANLSGRKLTAIRDLLMRQYQQVRLLWLQQNKTVSRHFQITLISNYTNHTKLCMPGFFQLN